MLFPTVMLVYQRVYTFMIYLVITRHYLYGLFFFYSDDILHQMPMRILVARGG